MVRCWGAFVEIDLALEIQLSPEPATWSVVAGLIVSLGESVTRNRVRSWGHEISRVLKLTSHGDCTYQTTPKHTI